MNNDLSSYFDTYFALRPSSTKVTRLALQRM